MMFEMNKIRKDIKRQKRNMLICVLLILIGLSVVISGTYNIVKEKGLKNIIEEVWEGKNNVK